LPRHDRRAILPRNQTLPDQRILNPVEANSVNNALTQLHHWICEHYNRQELRTRYFELGVEYDEGAGLQQAGTLCCNSL
jgi:hypothetical protein